MTKIHKFSDLHQENESRVELSSLPQDLNKSEFITQGFIIKVKDCDVRIRSSENQDGRIIYTMTAKYRPEHQESEVEISKEMFESLFPHTSSKQQKMRYKKSGWDIDQFSDGKIVAEYEFSKNESSIDIPQDWETKEHVESLLKDASWIKYSLLS